MLLGANEMTIRYADGRAVQAVILDWRNDKVRVGVEGEDDATDFTRLNGTWISADCEPVQIEFACQSDGQREPVSEADCICPKELASHLIHLLLKGDEDELVVAPNHRNLDTPSDFLRV
jgi:hypothetical protein